MRPLRRRSVRPRHRAFELKARACPHCGHVGALNRHSRLFGNNSARHAARLLRGQRVFCSARGSRGGCGHTFAIFLADVLPRRSVPGALFTRLLVGLLAGSCLHAAASGLNAPFAPQTFYRLVSRLRHGTDRVRAFLSRVGVPPPCAHPDPLRQTLAHLRAVFKGAADLVVAFQLRFQTPLIL